MGRIATMHIAPTASVTELKIDMAGTSSVTLAGVDLPHQDYITGYFGASKWQLQIAEKVYNANGTITYSGSTDADGWRNKIIKDTKITVPIKAKALAQAILAGVHINLNWVGDFNWMPSGMDISDGTFNGGGTLGAFIDQLTGWTKQIPSLRFYVFLSVDNANNMTCNIIQAGYVTVNRGLLTTSGLSVSERSEVMII